MRRVDKIRDNGEFDPNQVAKKIGFKPGDVESVRQLTTALLAEHLRHPRKNIVGCRIGINSGPIFAGDHDPDND